MASSDARCLVQDDWSFNSDGLSPCDVAAELAGVCAATTFTLEPLEPGFIYLGPTRTNVNACRCSSVYYSMLSACAECQGNDYLRWSAWNGNCSEVYLETYPRDIPTGVKVPHWAYIDVSIDDRYNATRAQAALGPESTAPPRPQSTRTNGGSSSRPSATGSSTATPSGEENKTNVGAIAGGVVGGVVGLALIGLLVFFLMRRRNKQKRAPSEIYSQNTGVPPSSMHGPAPGSFFDGNSGFTGGPEAKPFYNPNDPSTFPADHSMNSASPAPHLAGGPPSLSHNYTGQSAGYVPQVNTGHTGYAVPPPTFGQPNRPGTPNGGRYTGVPEL
ncbi:hypothetical protein BKA70DRAFT_1247150 [Coprinopsis sp. MPI-PUGE-AT-0042]|nr:hypothetical protein BKA70DRAFT_1247150 [Coprinopsis sp. MPI-PUGE-AT-0042]